MLFSLILVLASLNLAVGTCPNGTIPYYSDRTICFSFKTDKLDYMSAEGVCNDIGGHLASVRSIFENMIIRDDGNSYFNDTDDFWLGANAITGKWAWIDNTAFDFTDWYRNQPQTTSNTSCGAIMMQGGAWISDDCNKAKPFVCLVKLISTTTLAPTTTTVTGPKPTGCLNLWTYYPCTGYCYKVFENLYWHDAEERCKFFGGHLASIHSKEENMFAANLAYYPNMTYCYESMQALIGMSRGGLAEEWIWTDGSSMDYQNWSHGNPQNGSGHYYSNYGFMQIIPNCENPIGSFGNVDGAEVLAKYICKAPAF